MSRRSMQMPPAGALTWPSSEVPVPNAITGTPCLAQIRTTSWISAVSCAITTAAGGCGASQVVVWACWSRTACEVISRLPNRAASASRVLASACGSGRGKVGAVMAKTVSSLGRTVAKDQKAVKDRDVAEGMGYDDTGCQRGWADPRAVKIIHHADRAAMDRLQ